MGIELYEHNQTAYEAVLSMLAETGKAAVVHPTGTGKSFIGFKLCEDHPEKRVCWLSPSRHIFRTQLENLKAASGGFTPEKIRFLTYAKLAKMGEKEMEEIRPDMVILDEFHRCGADFWGAALRKFLNLCGDVTVLGLSATNVRYLDSQRDMAQELFDGNIASEMTLGEAIVRGILPAPKYVTAAFIYREELGKLEGRIARTSDRAARRAAERYYEALRRALEMADGLDEVFRKHMENPRGRYIVFTPNIRTMRACMAHIPDWFGAVDRDPHVYTLYTPDLSTQSSFEEFKADHDDGHLRLLFCIDALNEGIHVDGVDGVILFRPTSSPTVYKQQIGRALSAGCSGTPVIFDVVNNFEGLYSIGSLEEEMRMALTYYNASGEGDEIVAERFRVIDEVCECRRLFAALEEALTVSWNAMYAHAAAYYREHGDLNVPVRYRTPDGCSLGRWLNTQRQVRAGKAAGSLDEERIAKLDAIGMRWQGAGDLSWERHFAACLQYFEEHGNLDVPHSYVAGDGLKLGAWLKAIRSCRRSGTYTSYFTREREKLLDELGMVWNQPDYLWERNYAAARAYYEKHGDLDVPAKHVEDGVKLYNWLVDLRKMYRGAPGRRGVLSRDQIARLDALGMRWKSKRELAWDRGFAEAERYFEEHGAADAPLGYVTPEGYKLGVWLSKCREKYAKGTLPAERIAQLTKIGMVWDRSRRNDWDECFGKVRDYYIKHGNLAIPHGYVAGGVWLDKWLNEQKQVLRGRRGGKSLTEEQRRKLASISLTADAIGPGRDRRRTAV